MGEEIILKISMHLKEVRKEKNITITDLADKAGVTKGLISQIENNRTIPSLPVLMNLVQSLDLDITEFFKDLSSQKPENKVLVIRKADHTFFKKETAKGFSYQRILTKNIAAGPVDFVLLELKKGARRDKISVTDAYEYKYVIKGEISYLIGNKNYILNEGDSIFLDGRLVHNLSNVGDSEAIILVVYYFVDNN